MSASTVACAPSSTAAWTASSPRPSASTPAPLCRRQCRPLGKPWPVATAHAATFADRCGPGRADPPVQNRGVNIIILDDYQDAVRKLKCAATLQDLNAKVFTNTV